MLMRQIDGIWLPGNLWSNQNHYGGGINRKEELGELWILKRAKANLGDGLKKTNYQVGKEES